MIKKLFIGILVIFVLSATIFFGAGTVFPVVEYTTTIEIDRPRELTWQIMRGRRDWIYGFKSFEPVSGVPNQPGSKGRITVVRDGRETTFQTELLEITPPEYSVTRLSNDMLTHDAVVTLIEANGRTTIVSKEKLQGKNAFWRSVLAFFRGQIVEASRKSFDALKQAAESTL